MSSAFTARVKDEEFTLTRAKREKNQVSNLISHAFAADQAHIERIRSAILSKGGAIAVHEVVRYQFSRQRNVGRVTMAGSVSGLDIGRVD